MPDIEEDIGKLLRRKKLTLGTVESATSGLIAHRITNVTGSSDYYKGSVIAYSNGTKTDLVGVKLETIKKYGAVSSQVVRQMAEGGRRLLDVDICIADTGIAGPTGDAKNKPIGLFYLGLSSYLGTKSQKYIFQGNRILNKQSAADKALLWLKEYLGGLK